jgi:hypothetical protein
VAVDADGAFVGAVHAGDDLDQRRFAGAVLAQERMHLAGPDIEAHAAERLDPRKGFPDAFQLEDRLHTRHLLPPAEAGRRNLPNLSG